MSGRSAAVLCVCFLIIPGLGPRVSYSKNADSYYKKQDCETDKKKYPELLQKIYKAFGKEYNGSYWVKDEKEISEQTGFRIDLDSAQLERCTPRDRLICKTVNLKKVCWSEQKPEQFKVVARHWWIGDIPVFIEKTDNDDVVNAVIDGDKFQLKKLGSGQSQHADSLNRNTSEFSKTGRSGVQ